MRVTDDDFRKGTVTVHRRADDAKDPRTNQPQSKTKARELLLGDGLKSMTFAYVMSYRSTVEGAKKHDFLFCADVYLEQFVRWAYNAHIRGLDKDFLNQPLQRLTEGRQNSWGNPRLFLFQY